MLSTVTFSFNTVIELVTLSAEGANSSDSNSTDKIVSLFGINIIDVSPFGDRRV